MDWIESRKARASRPANREGDGLRRPLLILAYAFSKGLISCAAVLFGFGMGNIIMAQQLLTAEAFGTRDYSRIYATSQLVAVAGLAAGPPLAGLVSEVSGYTTAYLVVAAVSLLAVLACALAGPSPAKS